MNSVKEVYYTPYLINEETEAPCSPATQSDNDPDTASMSSSSVPWSRVTSTENGLRNK